MLGTFCLLRNENIFIQSFISEIARQAKHQLTSRLNATHTSIE